MGEASPAASGAFAPMLGVALGSRGAAVPPLHSAIVERLRARIELCRRHHSTCESRYRRGEAESADREHESTLHLLNIVQQGPGTRKGKAGRAPNQQAGGEQRGPDGDSKASMRMALHGSLRRKIEGQGPKPGAASCPFPGSDFKRARLDGAAPGLSTPPHFQGPSHRKNFPHGVGSDLFNMTLKEMKKEPSEVQSCGQSGPDLIFDFKDEGQLDPELQDLFDELTKSASPLNDLDLMLKQDEAFGLDLGRPPLDRPIKLEHSPDFGQVHCGSPQLRPASTGPAFTLAAAPSGGAPQKAGPGPRSMACWPEISHAEQLKQMAAATQQHPGALLHPQHPGPSWAPAVGPFQDPGPAPLARINPPAGNCLFKSNGLDLKVLGSKPGLHFSPKSGQLRPDPLAKSPAPQQHFQNQQGPAGPNLCLQAKTLHGPPFKMAPPRQASPSGPRQPVNGSLAAPALRAPAQVRGPLKRLNAPPLGQDQDGPLDQFSRHLTRPPPEYRDRSVPGLPQPFPGQSSSQLGPEKELHPCHAPHKMGPADRRFGADGPPQFQQHGGRLGPGQNKPRFLSPNAPGSSFGLNPVQHQRAAGDPGPLMTSASWGSANKAAGLGPRRPPGLLPAPADPYQQRQVGPEPRMLPLNPAVRPGQPVLSRASPEQRVPAGNFSEAGPGPGSYQGGRANRVTFDFLPEGDNTVPGINTDSDFIDSLLKSGSGTDDWMKDINLDEILGSGSML